MYMYSTIHVHVYGGLRVKKPKTATGIYIMDEVCHGVCCIHVYMYFKTYPLYNVHVHCRLCFHVHCTYAYVYTLYVQTTHAHYIVE